MHSLQNVVVLINAWNIKILKYYSMLFYIIIQNFLICINFKHIEIKFTFDFD